MENPLPRITIAGADSVDTDVSAESNLSPSPVQNALPIPVDHGLKSVIEEIGIALKTPESDTQINMIINHAVAVVSQNYNVSPDAIHSLLQANIAGTGANAEPSQPIDSQDEEIISAVVRRLLVIQFQISQAKKYAKYIQDFTKNQEIYGDPISFLAHAVEQVSTKQKIEKITLEQLVSDPLSSSEEIQKLSEERKAQILESLYYACVLFEENALVEAIDVHTLDIHQLIKSLQVSEEQKKQWEGMMSLKIPSNSRIKIIYVNGGEGLEMSDEEDHIRSAMKRISPNVTVVPLDNMTMDKNAILARMKLEMTDKEYDIVIPFFSSHGITKSSSRAGLGFTEVNAPDDTFYVVNGPGHTAIDNSIHTHGTQAKEIAKKLVLEHPDMFTNIDGSKRVIAPGEFVTKLDSHTITALTPIHNEKELSTRIFQYFLLKQIESVHIGTQDMLRLQKEVTKTTSAKFIYILDCCFSGSATDDELAKPLSTQAILASSAEEQLSLQDRQKKRGAFMHTLFEMIEEGCSLGEAFVRADILLNYSRGSRSLKGWQNPRAFLRKENGDVQKVSSVLHDVSPERGIG